MAHLVKYQHGKDGDLHLDPQYPHKVRHGGTCLPPALEGSGAGERWFPEASWPISLDSWDSRLSGRPCLNLYGGCWNQGLVLFYGLEKILADS